MEETIDAKPATQAVPKGISTSFAGNISAQLTSWIRRKMRCRKWD